MNLIALVPSLLWISMISYFLVRWHLRNLWIAAAQVRVTAAGPDPELLLMARNQHVRYLIRTAESVAAILVGGLGMLETFYPALARNPALFLVTLSFFFATQAATGYLSYRDLKIFADLERIEDGVRV